MKYIALLTVFLFLGSKSVLGQEKSKFLVYPGCEKFDSKGNKKLIDCYSTKFNELLASEVKQVLRNNNLSINSVNVNARIKYEINKEGEYQNLEIIGTEAENYF